MFAVFIALLVIFLLVKMFDAKAKEIAEREKREKLENDLEQLRKNFKLLNELDDELLLADIEDKYSDE